MGSLTTRHNFCLADISDDCIRDYLKPAGALLDLAEQTMTVRDTVIPLLGTAKKVEPVCCHAIAAVTTTLPPNSEAVVPVHLVDGTRDWRPGWGLLQLTESHSNDGLHVGL